VVGIEDQLAQMTVGGGRVRWGRIRDLRLCHHRRRCLFELWCWVCLLAVKWLLVSIKIGFSLMMKDPTTGFLFVKESHRSHSLRLKCRLWLPRINRGQAVAAVLLLILPSPDPISRYLIFYSFLYYFELYLINKSKWLRMFCWYLLYC
jgi:hypothetical protein